jgi:cation:H+ antiporter
MSTPVAIPLFLVSFAATIAAAEFCARRLDELGVRLGMPEALLGFLTALASDAPELASAVVALLKGARDVSLGVVVGSNIFNLAAMIGVSALLVGSVRIRREVALLEGLVALLVTLVSGALVLRWLSPWPAVALLALFLVPYLVLLARGPDVFRRLPFRLRFATRLAAELDEAYRPQPSPAHSAPFAPAADELHTGPIWIPATLMVPAVAVIILGATGMVETSLTLATRWHLPHVVVGVFVLATLTSLPDTYMAIRLALARRGLAVVSATFHSNTLNLVGAVMLPALIVAVAPVTGLVKFDLAWLLGITIVAVLLLSRRRGADRPGGILLVAFYLAFVAVHAGWG